MGPGNQKCKSIPLRCRMRDVQSCCLPAISFRAYWWQMSGAIADRVNSLQRRLVAILLRTRPHSLEGWPSFRLRRGRLVAAQIRTHGGLWGEHVAKRIISWHQHISRNHSGGWAGKAYLFMDESWFYQRRVECGSKSGFGGRTMTRTSKGPPRVRYHDGVRFSNGMLA